MSSLRRKDGRLWRYRSILVEQLLIDVTLRNVGKFSHRVKLAIRGRIVALDGSHFRLCRLTEVGCYVWGIERRLPKHGIVG